MGMLSAKLNFVLEAFSLLPIEAQRMQAFKRKRLPAGIHDGKNNSSASLAKKLVGSVGIEGSVKRFRSFASSRFIISRD